MKFFELMSKTIVSGAIIVALAVCSTGCAKSEESSGTNGDPTGLTTSSGTSSATQVGDTAFSEAYNALKSAKLGDKISGSTYLVSVANGMKTYYIHGRYVLVSAETDTVVQLRDEIEVPNTSLSIREIIESDKEFDIAKATVSFFSSDNTQVSGTLDDTVTSTITDCVVEYADWEDETETFGIVQSYLFTYGYVPVKITGYYEASSDNSSDTTSSTEDSTSSESESSNTSTNMEGTASDTSSEPVSTEVETSDTSSTQS